MTVPSLRCTIDAASADADRTELLVLGPSLGTTTSIWSAATALLAEVRPDLRRLRFDLPGHGASPACSAPFTIGDVAEAVVALVDATGGGRFHYAGVSLGAGVGLELALRYPERLLSLTVIAGDAKFGDTEGWQQRARDVRGSGTASLVIGSAERWFASDFSSRNAPAVSRALSELTEVDDESYALACEALAAFDVRDEVGAITVQTLVVSGGHDQVVSSAAAAALAASIPGASHRDIATASHQVSLEAPDEVTAALTAFIPAARGSLAVGLRTRRAVLGDAHVDRARALTTPETADFQDFLTRYAWGEVWSRPGLGRRERSIATLASLVTGGHHAEISMHVRAALTNGLSREEISEVLLHTALYAGLPAANSAFAIARDVFAEIDATQEDLHG